MPDGDARVSGAAWAATGTTMYRYYKRQLTSSSSSSSSSSSQSTPIPPTPGAGFSGNVEGGETWTGHLLKFALLPASYERMLAAG